MAKFQKLKVSEISIPKDVISVVSDQKRQSIADTFGTESEALFFPIVVESKGKYTLIDRYEVYVAARTKGRKTINCAVLKEHDTFTSHMTLSLKPLPNPVTVLRLIKPYVERDGIEHTTKTFHLNSMYARLYPYYPKPHVIKDFERIIHLAYTFDAQTIVPVKVFEILQKTTPQETKMIMKKLQDMINATKSKFNWPAGNLLDLIKSERPKVKKERTAVNDIREYQCEHCNADIVITPNHVGLKEEKDGVILISGEDKSEPHYVPDKYKKHLHITPETPPTVISSKDIDDWSALKRRLYNKNFLIFVDTS